MFERKRYQFGYVRQKSRKTGPHVWVWEYRDRSGSHSVILGTVEEMSEVEAWKATESRRLIINDPQPANQTSFGAVIDRYVREALPETSGNALPVRKLDQYAYKARVARRSNRPGEATFRRALGQRFEACRKK
jgi:hypothetical protein